MKKKHEWRIEFYQQWDFLWDSKRLNWIDFDFLHLGLDSDKTSNTFQIYFALLGFRITITRQGLIPEELQARIDEITILTL